MGSIVRKLFTLAILSALVLSVGCSAFKDSYGSSGEDATVGGANPSVAAPGANPSQSSAAVCTAAVEGVIASIDSKLSVGDNIGWLKDTAEGETGLATAEKVADDTVTIHLMKGVADDAGMIASASGSIDMTIKKEADDKAMLCSLVYKKGGAEVKIASGTVVISKFMEGEDVAKAVTSGYFKLTLASESTEATKVIKMLVSKADAAADAKTDMSSATVLEGNFMITGVSEAAKAPDAAAPATK